MKTPSNPWRRLAWAVLAVIALADLGGAGVGLVPRAAAAEQSAGVPQISVSLRGDGSGTIEAGEPFHVAVRLDGSRDATRAIELAPSSGTWVDAVQVELLPAGVGAVAAKAESAGQPESAAATLDAKRIAGGVWRFPAAATRGLAAGEYRLRARLVLKEGRGWTGEATTDDIPVRVVAALVASAANGATSSVASTQRIVTRAQDALLNGALESAAGILDEALKKTPLEARLLAMRALVAERAGNLPAAVICANAAMRAAANSPIRHPDGEFLALQGLFARARRAATVSIANVPAAPAWSWPPIEVITAITADAANSEFGKSMSAAPRTIAATVPSAAPVPPVSKPAAQPEASTSVPPATSTATAPGSSPIAAASAASMPGSGSSVVIAAAELSEEKILADSAGQWASAAAAGSQYSSPNYAPAKMTGPPDVPKAGDSINAWCHGSASKADEWVELTFAKPVHATELRVRQNNAPGAIVKVEVFEPDGTAHVWWNGVDPFKAPAQATLAWFAVRVPRTSYLVAKVKLTLNLAAVAGWKEIDAVQLVGEP